MMECFQWPSPSSEKHHLKFYFPGPPLPTESPEGRVQMWRGEKGVEPRWAEPTGIRLLNWKQGCDGLVWAPRTSSSRSPCQSQVGNHQPNAALGSFLFWDETSVTRAVWTLSGSAQGCPCPAPTKADGAAL